MNLFSLNSPYARGIQKAVVMIYTGILWFIFSLPVVTAGAATTALLEVLMKAAKNEEGYLTASFLKAFRNNFRKSTQAWLPLLVCQLIFAINLFYYAILGGGQYPVQTVVFGLLTLFVSCLSSFVFPLMARFENPVKDTFRLAVNLIRQNAGWAVVLLGINLIFFFVTWFFVYLPLLFAMGILGYVQAVIFNHIFDRLMDQGKIVEKGI